MNKKNNEKAFARFLNSKDNKLQILKQFILDNHETVNKYHHRHYKRLASTANSKLDIIKLLFLHALNAAGGAVPLDPKYESFDRFCQKINNISNPYSFTFNHFAKCFIEDYSGPKDYHRLSEYFVGGGASAFWA